MPNQETSISDRIEADADNGPAHPVDSELVSSASSASPLATDKTRSEGGAAPEIARPDLRRLATQFMSKPATQRVAIGLDLGVIQDSDLSAEHREDLFRVILRRVREGDLIERLAAKVGQP